MHQETTINKQYIENLNLGQQWPSSIVRRLFEILLVDYINLTKKCECSLLPEDQLDFSRLLAPFTQLCANLVVACRHARSQCSSLNKSDKHKQYIELINLIDSDQIPQVVSSALAMILHCDPRQVSKKKPTNSRRQYCRFSTYPNSPGLSQLMSDFVFGKLPKQVFATAAVRSFVITGAKEEETVKHSVKAVVSRSISDLDKNSNFRIRSFQSSRLKTKNWLNLLLLAKKSISKHNTQSLSISCDIYTGRRGRSLDILSTPKGHTGKECKKLFSSSLPFNYASVILSRNIKPFAIESIRFHTRLDSESNNYFNWVDRQNRIAVREFVDPNGRLTVAPINFYGISVKGVITIHPCNMNVHLLAGILGSSTIASWIKQNTGALINPRFHAIAAADLHQLPIPKEAIGLLKEKCNSKSDKLNICNKVIQCVKQMENLEPGSIRSENILTTIDRLVIKLYKT